MADLCVTLDREVSAAATASAGLQNPGALLARRSLKLRTRIDACGARALQQVRSLTGPPAHSSESAFSFEGCETWAETGWVSASILDRVSAGGSGLLCQR
jgi:hypothetical protein